MERTTDGDTERLAMNPASLIDHAESYLLARPTCRPYARQIRSRVAAFVAWINGAPVTSDSVNAFLVTIEGRGLQPETVRGYRTSLLAVLRFAGWQPDRPIRCTRLRERPVECFTLDQIRQLIETGATLPGVLSNGVPLAEFWPLAVDAGYTTGLRWGDLTAVLAADVNDDGSCAVTQGKTGRVVHVQFSPAAVARIRRHGLTHAVPWPHSGNHFRTEFRALTIAAGIGRGSWKWLRRAAGSYVEAASPGNGHKMLGNTPATFLRHYWARGTVAPKPLSPPMLARPWWRKFFRPTG
jgi:hypothetical protein